MSDWVPDNENDKLLAFSTFSRALAGRAAVYGVSGGDAAEAARLVEQLKAAMTAANNPATRTVLTTAAKREAKSAADKFFRRLAAFIRLNPSISAADLAAIGLPPKAEKRRVPPPNTVPMLSIRRIITGGHEIEMRDSSSPDRLSKPPDAKGLELFVAYSPHHGNSGHGNGGEPLTSDAIVTRGKPHGILTRKVSAVIHPNERVGSVANYVGRWINNRGEAGPFSQPVRMVLAIPNESRLSEAA